MSDNLSRVGVEFTGSARGAIVAARETAGAIDKVKRSAAGSSVPLRGMEKDLGRVERGALAGSGAFKGLGRSVAFASGAFLGAAGLTEAIKHSIDVTLAAQTSIAHLDQAIKNAHASVKALTPIMEEHAAAARRLGFDDNDTRDAEAKLVTAFGATKHALDELTAAQDLARQSNIPLGDATRQLILLQEGNARAAKQFGLSLPDLTAKQWAAKAAADGLNVAQEKGKTLYDELLPRINDQAAAFANTPAGKIAEFHAQVTHLEESIGTGLLPVVDKYLTEVDDWLAKGDNQRKVTADVKKVVDELAGVLGDAKNMTERFVTAAAPVVHELGGWKTILEGIIALKFASTVAGWVGPVKNLTGALGKLKGMSPIEVSVAIIGAVAVEEFLKWAHGENKTNKAAGQTGVVQLTNPDGSTSTYAVGGGRVAGVSVEGAVDNSPSSRVSGVDRSNHPGVQGAGAGLAWSGDYAGLDAGFKSKLASCVADAGGTHISVTSGRRSVEHNAAVGGAHNSNHLTGHAADGTCTINGSSFPLGAAPIDYAKFGLRAGSTFNWGGSPDIYHVDDGANVGGAATTSPYGPSTSTPAGTPAPAKPPPWKGAAQATITTIQGGVLATLRGLPTSLDPVEKNAVAHIDKIRDALHIHMTPAELAKDRVELTRWGKVLHDEISKQAKVVAAAAAEAKKKFDQALSLDISHVLRDFDQAFSAQMLTFDRETQRGLAKFVVAQTPEEKALADFIAQRGAEQHAATVAQQQSDLAAAIASGDPAQIKAAQDAINNQLEDDQQAALQAAADASRVAQDAKTTADQQAYQDQRDQQKQALQNINDDQRIALQNNLDDWTTWIDKKKKTWTEFLTWLQNNGFDTSTLINPGASGSGSGGGGADVTRLVSPGAAIPFATGGRVPGQYVGRQDTILARLTPGEHVAGRKLTAAMEDFFLGGGGGGARPTYVATTIQVNGRDLAHVLAPAMDAEMSRLSGYQIPRG